MDLTSAQKASPGDQIAVLSPSFAAPAVAAAVHEQAMDRLEQLTGLAPVEYLTTRKLGASARQRADDINAAFGDPAIFAVIASIGGEDQITVIPHLDGQPVVEDPKPFLGYSDNTNLAELAVDTRRRRILRRLHAGPPRSRPRLDSAGYGHAHARGRWNSTACSEPVSLRWATTHSAVASFRAGTSSASSMAPITGRWPQTAIGR